MNKHYGVRMSAFIMPSAPKLLFNIHPGARIKIRFQRCIGQLPIPILRDLKPIRTTLPHAQTILPRIPKARKIHQTHRIPRELPIIRRTNAAFHHRIPSSIQNRKLVRSVPINRFNQRFLSRPRMIPQLVYMNALL